MIEAFRISDDGLYWLWSLTLAFRSRYYGGIAGRDFFAGALVCQEAETVE